MDSVKCSRNIILELICAVASCLMLQFSNNISIIYLSKKVVIDDSCVIFSSNLFAFVSVHLTNGQVAITKSKLYHWYELTIAMNLLKKRAGENEMGQ